MTEVCVVANSVGPTSIPADIAREVAGHPDFEVRLVAWFGADPIETPDSMTITSITVGSETATTTAFSRLASAIRNCDVVHTHHSHSGSIAKALAFALGKPVVATENASHHRLSMAGHAANGLTNALADRIVCISEHVCDSFGYWERLLTRGKRTLVHNGVDMAAVQAAREQGWLAEHHDVDTDGFVIGHAASMKPVKSQRTLIEAVADCHESGHSVDLVIAGGGTLRGALERLAQRRGVGDSVHFTGQLSRTAVYKLFWAVDAVAMPSLDETFCVAVAEAMAAETPCILSEIPVFRELYGDAACYHPTEDPAALADCIRRLAV